MEKEIAVDVTILCGSDGWVEMEFEDSVASTRFLTLRMSAKEFTAALGRLSHSKATGTVRGLERVGKVHQCDTLEVALPFGDEYVDRKELVPVAVKAIKKVCPEGWIPSMYFGGQSSFFKRDGRQYARVTIRRYIDPEEVENEDANKT